MSRIVLESALRILLAHRNDHTLTRAERFLTRALILSDLALLSMARAA